MDTIHAAEYTAIDGWNQGHNPNTFRSVIAYKFMRLGFFLGNVIFDYGDFVDKVWRNEWKDK